MKRSTVVLSLTTTSFIALGLVAWFSPEESVAAKKKSGPVAVVGNPQKVKRAYERWRTEFEATSAPRIDVGLGWSRGMSTEFTRMHGGVSFDLNSGAVTAELKYAPEGECFDVWLTSRTPASKSVGIEPADRFTQLGTITGGGAQAARLDTNLARISADVLELDLLVVTHSGKTPLDEVLAVGMPSLFQRVWTRERAGDVAPTTGSSAMSLALIMPAAAAAPAAPLFDDLVAFGEELFFQATFEGNGRTCGSCHPAENNLTLDVPFIEEMFAANPNDPLFVAEFDTNLMAEFNEGKQFENPTLMHEQGLILENVDGFEDLQNRFVMRAVSHVFAQGVSIDRPEFGIEPPVQRTGWAGDGAPGSGTLREFSIGAVTQHFTKGFDRVEGVDFILPTEDELDALEAFQLSLGRDADPSLQNLAFSDAQAQSGVLPFLLACDKCHADGGANSQLNFTGPVPDQVSATFANGNFNTGVEQRLQNLIGGPFPDRPIDAGFGVVPDPALFGPDDMVPNDDGSFGDRNFNAQSVIEAADTVPSFHNNLTALAGAYSSTIEDAVAFYTTDEFEVTVPPGMVVLLDSEPMDNADPNPLDQRVLNIGRLLRSLNAMENARSASSFASRAQELGDAGMDEVFIARALDLAIRDSKDGIVVQEEVGLNPASVDHFNTAIDLINQALDSGLPWQDRSDLIDQALDKLDSAKTDIAI